MALIVAVALVSWVESDVGAGYAYPLQLVFVPVLFLLPPSWAPLVLPPAFCSPADARSFAIATSAANACHDQNARACGGTCAGTGRRGRASPLALEGRPLYLLALVAQLLGDTATGAVREWLVRGASRRGAARLAGRSSTRSSSTRSSRCWGGRRPRPWSSSRSDRRCRAPNPRSRPDPDTTIEEQLEQRL